MAKEKLIIYACPFCRAECWFDKMRDLSYHLFKSHAQETYDYLANNCKRKVTKTEAKWNA